MEHCFVCGRALKPESRNLRRKVRTGEWLRRPRKDARLSTVRVSFGMRVVCRECARRIDREGLWDELARHPEIAFLFLLFIAGLLARFL